MKLYLQGHEERYALEQLQLSLFPEAVMEYSEEPFEGDGAVSALFRGKTLLTASTVITLNGKKARGVSRMPAADETVSLRRNLLQRSYYRAALQLLGDAPPWGALAGVRPSKLSTRHLLSGGSPASADRLLRDLYFVSPSRRRLCLECSEATLRANALLEPTDFSLYVGIPFCPSRCSYCSFVSNSIEKCGDLLEPFLQALLREVRETGKLFRNTPFRVRTLYVGGGTPTTLSAEQLDRLMTALEEAFDLSRLIEYTVEGGRPDTLSPEKMRVLRSHGCDRISINPQTMSDEVLRRVGRRHSAEDVVRCYEEARNASFSAVNMDLIAGLPGDSPEGFIASLVRLLDLGPANVTVHTLALKKGADLFQTREGLLTDTQVAEMLSRAEELLRGAGYLPYYLYKQKYMSGSFENIGWCRPGFEGLYNVYMMEELHSVLALGGGGMNKVNLPKGKILRFHNPKYPREYLVQLDSTLAQKKEILRLMEGALRGEDPAPQAEEKE